MRIILGSTSEDKKKILEETLKDHWEDLEIELVDVNSEITDQPLSEEITKTGALNRAKNAFKLVQKGDLYLGLEGGLQEMEDGNYALVCVAVIQDKMGQVHLGVSDKRPLPKKVSQKVKNGEQFGVVIREYQKTANKSEQVLVESLIDRKESFNEAVKNALLLY